MSETVNRAIAQMFLLMHSKRTDYLFKLNLPGLVYVRSGPFRHFNYSQAKSCIFGEMICLDRTPYTSRALVLQYNVIIYTDDTWIAVAVSERGM